MGRKCVQESFVVLRGRMFNLGGMVKRVLNRQEEVVFWGDFLVPGGTTPITVVAHAVHGSFIVQTVPRGIARVVIKGESVGSCGF
jgi:hypothetical protein